MKRGGVGTGSKCLSFAYGLACALQFCVGKTAIIWREVFRTGSMFMSNVMSVYFFNRNHYVYGGVLFSSKINRKYNIYI